LQSGTICNEDLYDLDDQELFRLLETKNHPLFHLAGKVKQGQLYPVLLETPFNTEEHQTFLDIHGRTNIEAAIAEKLSTISGQKILSEDIIFDLPEPFSLETDLFVQDENASFNESSSVFNQSSVKNLENALRIIRIFINPAYEKSLKQHPNIQETLNH
jgi:hypothetical protein